MSGFVPSRSLTTRVETQACPCSATEPKTIVDAEANLSTATIEGA